MTAIEQRAKRRLTIDMFAAIFGLGVAMILLGMGTLILSTTVVNEHRYTAAKQPFEFTGTVSRVLDGDTIEVNEGGEIRRVRLLHIDAPEKTQPFGKASQGWLEKQCLHWKVKVEWKGHDRYGRLLGDVRMGQKNINLAIVEAGLAWQYKDDRDIEYATAMESAKRSRFGLWGDPQAIAPWDWRKGLRPAAVNAVQGGDDD